MWSILLLSLGVFLLCAIHQTIHLPSLRTYFLFRRLPGPVGIPLLGVALELFFTEPWKTFNVIKKYSKKYPKLICAYILGLPIVVLTEPEHIQVILSSKQHINKGKFYSFFKTWLLDGVLTSTGDKWKSRRKLLVDSLHQKIIENSSDVIWNEALTAVTNILKEKGNPVSVNKHFYTSTLNVICETAMGVSMNTQKQENKDYSRALKSALQAVLYRTMNLYLNRDWIWELTTVGRQFKKDVHTLNAYSEKVIQQKMAEYKTNNDDSKLLNNLTFNKGKRKPVLDLLLDQRLLNPDNWKMTDIQEEVNAIIFAGHDTSSITASFAVWMLGLNPEIQDKAYAEMFEIFGDDDRKVTNEDLGRMHYLDKIIKETMRKFPAVPVITRTLSEDVKFDGFPLIPSGCNILICLALIHRNEETFPEPNVFNPERFTPEEIAKRHPYSYIPFSAGVRSCIGKKLALYELKVLLSTIIRFCQIKPFTKEEDVELIPSVTLQPTPQLKVIVEPRKREFAFI